MKRAGPGRTTPVVGGLLIAHAAAGILLGTVLTLPELHQALAFDPALAFRRPWTFLTYPFVAAGLPSLGANLLLLGWLGPAVEERMGGRRFFLYYVACGLVSAWFALGLTSVMNVPPLRGAGGSVLGVAFAFAVLWPDAYLNLDPLPVRPRIRGLIAGLASLAAGLAVLVPGAGSHLAHLGGLLAGYAYFRVLTLRGTKPRPPLPASVIARPVRTAVTVPQGGAPESLRPARPPESPRERYSSEELDRVLDKISASGLASLTPEERRFLDQMAARKRKEAD
jgi:membrane associated rhomboid family serine protease